MAPFIHTRIVEPKVGKARQFSHECFEVLDAAFQMVDAVGLAEPPTQTPANRATGRTKPLALNRFQCGTEGRHGMNSGSEAGGMS
jgi:hypothetical protein